MAEYTFDKGYSVGISGEMKGLWLKKIVEVLKYVIDVCNKHHLRYYGAYGTTIGAVRHHGLIPWDDDIDIHMPRPDYNKLIELMSKQRDCPYSIIFPKLDNDYYLVYAKVYDNRCTLLERKDERCIIGPFVDIFPLDGCTNDQSLAKSLFYDYRKYIGYWEYTVAYWNVKDYFENLKSKHFGLIMMHTVCHLFKKAVRKYALKQMHKIESQFEYDKSDMVIVWCTGHFYDEYYKRSWFGDGVKCEFEDFSMVIPSNYDAYLKCIYGDYMKLPPEEDRVSHHYVAYLNMNERETLKQVVKKIHNNGNNK